MKNNKLHNITSAGFKTHYEYFESLDDKIFSKLKEDDISAKVNSSGFKLPEGYFENLEDKIFDASDNARKSKVLPLFSWKNAAYLTGIAASVILVFSLFFVNTNELTFDDLETASIENYLMNEDLNTYDIMPFLGANEMNSEDFVENKLNVSDIEDYLLQNSDVEHLITD